jgi:MFS transporter, ACS family, glucarate transporter
MEAGQPPPAPPGRPTHVRWTVFVLACGVSWLLYLHRYSWGVIKPTIKQENPWLTDTQLGWLDSAFQATYALGQVPGGLIGDLFGPRLILAVLILLWSLAGVGVIWTRGFWPLFGVRGAFGLAQAGAYPVLNKVTRNWFPLAGRTTVQGVIAALGRIGAACCPVILATFLMGWLGLSWQTALVVLAVPGVVLAVAFWLLVRNSPKEHPWSNDAERQLVDGPPSPPAGGQPPPPLLRDRASLISLGSMLVYAFASTFQDQLYVYWIPSFLVEGRNLDNTQMGLFTALPLLGGAAGSVLGGGLNDVLLRAGLPRRWVRSGVGLAGKLVAAALVVVSVQVADGWLAMVVLLGARVFGDWSLPTQWGAITDMAGRSAGTVFGLVNTVGAVGGFVAGPVLGYLKQYYGWEGLFAGVAVMCAVSAFTWLFIDCTRRLVPERG